MSQNPIVALSHIGICTADVERSLKFYTEGLGFTLDSSIPEIGAPFDALMELQGTKCQVHYVVCGATKLELIGYIDAPVTGSAERRPMNQLGFTHLTLIVSDLNAAVARVVEFGGKVHTETKVDSPFGPIVFCTDPDGVRIELFQAAG
jgi:predicted enzyme related to lactoylglutathione lyase